MVTVVDRKGERLSSENARFTVDLFPGFFNALKACYVSWDVSECENIDNHGTRNPSIDQVCLNNLLMYICTCFFFS